MCDVPSTAVFCSESTECFPGVASKYSFKPLVTVPVAPVTAGVIMHFIFHIRCISVHKLLHFSAFPASFCVTFLSAGTITSISTHVFSFLSPTAVSDLFAVSSLSEPQLPPLILKVGARLSLTEDGSSANTRNVIYIKYTPESGQRPT
jgi:hypothetical protein